MGRPVKPGGDGLKRFRKIIQTFMGCVTVSCRADAFLHPAIARLDRATHATLLVGFPAVEAVSALMPG